MDAFLLHKDYREKFRKLSPEELKAVIMAMYDFICDGTDAELENYDRFVQGMYEDLKRFAEICKAKQQAKGEKMRQNALKRWESETGSQKTNGCKSIQKHTNGYKSIQTDAKAGNIIKENIIKENITENNNTDTNVSSLSRNNAEADLLKTIKEYFNAKVENTPIPQITSIMNQRAGAVRARAREHGEGKILQVIDKVAESDFLNGKNSNTFIATFDWIFKPNNFAKILEGNYDNKAITKQHGNDNELSQSERNRLEAQQWAIESMVR